MPDNPVVRKARPLTKSRSKALVADGLQAAVSEHGIEDVARASGTSTRCIQKALAHETLMGADHLADLCDLDTRPLGALLAAKGLRISPAIADPANDMELAAGLGHGLAELIERLRDGKRCHVDTAVLAALFRQLVPQMQAIIDEDDARRAA